MTWLHDKSVLYFETASMKTHGRTKCIRHFVWMTVCVCLYAQEKIKRLIKFNWRFQFKINKNKTVLYM